MRRAYSKWAAFILAAGSGGSSDRTLSGVSVSWGRRGGSVEHVGSVPEVGRMNRRATLFVGGAVVALCVVAILTQANARRAMERERGQAEILERTADGHVEHHTSAI